MIKTRKPNKCVVWAAGVCAVEAVESRVLLSGVTFSGNTLTVTGSAAADVIDVNYQFADTAQFDLTATLNGVQQTFHNVPLQKVLINAGDGNNTVTVEGFASQSTVVVINTGSGNDSITTDVGSDAGYLGVNLTINDGNGNDTVTAGANGNAVVNAGSGNDLLVAQASYSYLPNDITINGGSGNDTIVAAQGGAAFVTAYGNGGKSDTFEMQDIEDSLAAYGGSGVNTFYRNVYTGNEDGVIISNDGKQHGNLLLSSNIRNITGYYDGNVTFIANPTVNTNIDVADFEGVVSLVGGSGNDTLGADYADSNSAGATAFFKGGSGRSLMIPGTGINHFSNGTGIATADFSNSTANLKIYLDGSQDSGDPNATAYNYANGGTQVTGLFDTFDGTVQNVIGGSGNNLIEGTGGNNVLVGGSGNDTLVSNGGTDALFGGGGDDTFQARDGAQTYIDGGAGTNTAYTDPYDTIVNVQNINPDEPAPAQLTGAVIGTSGSYHNLGNTIGKVFDGNLSTYFDAPTASGNYVGLDLGTAKVVNQLSFAPRAGFQDRMVGGQIQGSNSPSFAGAVTLYTIGFTPVPGALTTVGFASQAAYRYIRYVGPANSFCNIAELKLFHTGAPFTKVDSSGNLVVNGTTGDDNINVTFFADNTDNFDVGQTFITTVEHFTITENGYTETFANSSVKHVEINTFSGNDTVTVNGYQANSANVPLLPFIDLAITAGDGNESITTSLGFDEPQPTGASVKITAGNGNDYLYEQGGANQTIIAGNGNDTLISSATNGSSFCQITAGDGNDSFTAGSAGDGGDGIHVNAGNGRDTYFNSDFEDGLTFLTGGAGPVYLSSQAAAITGKVFIDTNGDGKYESGEPVVAKATVYLDNNNDGISDAGDTSVVTDSNGNYQFTSLTPGVPDSTYQVGVVLPAGTKAFQPGNGLFTVSLSRGHGVSGDDFALKQTSLRGKIIGTPGSYRNHGTNIANVFDGNLATFFDGPDASGDWVGLDLGSAKVATQVKYAPRAGYESRMVGGKIQASNTADFSSGVVTLYTITTAPASGVFTTKSLNNTIAYRYYRYIGPANSYCDIAELEFDG